MSEPDDRDREAAQRRADELRELIEEAKRGGGTPASPREFTDRAAREAAEEDRTPDP
jgi:hypothetical protein